MGLAVSRDELRVAVMFYGDSDHWSRHWLSAGFRHVDCVLQTEIPEIWIAVVGKIGGILAPVVLVDFDPVVHAQARDAKLLLLPCHRPALRRTPVMLSSCVGVVKAVLGIRDPRIITPLQLYRRLTR